MLKLLTRTEAEGAEHYPRRGPYIIAGNHRAIMEIVLMQAYAPHFAEILGAGDIPLDHRYRWLGQLYGFIPYFRGTMDSAALRQALEVLKQGGVVGIFPEGGIWRSARTGAHRGVAWLSYASGAPVVPVAFAGIESAIYRTFRLQYPRMAVRVGEPIPAPRVEGKAGRKRTLAEFGERVLDTIDAMVPEWDRKSYQAPAFEEYHIELECADRHHRTVHQETWDDDEGQALGSFFHHPVLLEVFYKNLKRAAAHNLAHLHRWKRPQGVVRACKTILGYVRVRNPNFLTYRLGDREGKAAYSAFQTLCRFAGRAAERHERLRITPVHQYRMPGEELVHRETRPGKPAPL
jgi:1-acyl-sn-glycerol-3-phosphate acyltransferase